MWLYSLIKVSFSLAPLKEAIKPMPRGVAGICMKVQPPSSCGMPLVTAAWCGFLRDGIEGEVGEGGGGWSMNTVQPETQETGEGGAVSASPLPVEPPPPRGDSPTDTVSREETTTSRSHLTLPEIRFPSPVHGYPDYRHLLPAPWKGAGGGRGSGRAAGVIDSLPEYRSR